MDRLQPENDPASIERRSFAIIDTEAGDHKPFSGLCWEVARRLVHTTADFSILETLVVPEKAVAAGVVALRASCSVFTDTRMALAGIPKRRLEPLGVTATCLLSLPGVDERAKSHGTTLSCAALELAGDRIENTILAVGNAPTTLIAFIKYLRAGGPPWRWLSACRSVLSTRRSPRNCFSKKKPAQHRHPRQTGRLSARGRDSQRLGGNCPPRQTDRMTAKRTPGLLPVSENAT